MFKEYVFLLKSARYQDRDMLNFRSAYFWPLAWRNFYASSTPPEFDHPRLTPTHTNLVILGHLVLLTRTAPGLSWKRLALSTSELIRSDTRIFAPKQNHSWSPINFWWQITKGWKAMTNYVLNRPKWRQPKTTTSGGLSSLTVISANLWSNEQANMIIMS